MAKSPNEPAKKEPAKPPEISPFVFPVILAAMGIWCLYDGFFSTNPEMQEHLLFNRVLGGVLLPWALIDFYRTFRSEKKGDE